MKVLFSNKKLNTYCTSVKAANKLFGGNRALVVSLMARIYAMERADVIKDIILMPTFRFHGLKGKMDGLFAIDVRSRKDKWRIIIQPLDENENAFIPCHIDQIADKVKTIEIKEVSRHYE